MVQARSLSSGPDLLLHKVNTNSSPRVQHSHTHTHTHTHTQSVACRATCVSCPALECPVVFLFFFLIPRHSRVEKSGMFPPSRSQPELCGGAGARWEHFFLALTNSSSLRWCAPVCVLRTGPPYGILLLVVERVGAKAGRGGWRREMGEGQAAAAAILLLSVVLHTPLWRGRR